MRFHFNFRNALLATLCASALALSANADIPLPPLSDGEHTVVVIPDTQYYTGKDTKRTPDSNEPISNGHLEQQVNWILENRDKQRIKFVTHVGDIVDRNKENQWEVANTHLSKLITQVPLSLTVGNHDVKSKGSSLLFQNYFGAERFKKFDWYIGYYPGHPDSPDISGNNANSAQLIQLGNHTILHLSLECNAPDPVLEWARGVIAKHPKKEVWITTHMDLGIVPKPKNSTEHIHGEKGRMQWKKVHGEAGNTPQQLWDKFYSTIPNLRLILSGDQSRVTAIRREDRNKAGKVVHALLSDYQSQPVLRLMRFNPKSRVLKVISIDLRRKQLVQATEYVSDATQHQFEIQLEPIEP